MTDTVEMDFWGETGNAILTRVPRRLKALTRRVGEASSVRQHFFSFLIEAAGAQVRYLPLYSPDLNPIELAFSNIKKLLRDGAQRTTEKLWNLCGSLLSLVTESECRNHLRHCGYRYS